LEGGAILIILYQFASTTTMDTAYNFQKGARKSYSDIVIQSNNHYSTNNFDNHSENFDRKKITNRNLNLISSCRKVERFRTYPCQNFVCSGGCPYHDRCTFLHDSRIKSDREVYRLEAKKVSEPKDTFYWPDMEIVDSCQDKVSNDYNIPSNFSRDKSNQHDCSVLSIWYINNLNCLVIQFITVYYFYSLTERSHFTDFLFRSRQTKPFLFPDVKIDSNKNNVIDKDRLPVFIALSLGENLLAYKEILEASMELEIKSGSIEIDLDDFEIPEYNNFLDDFDSHEYDYDILLLEESEKKDSKTTPGKEKGQQECVGSPGSISHFSFDNN
jgi:hypothetical protein